MSTKLLARAFALASLCLLSAGFLARTASAAVGATEAHYGVSRNGAVAYSIPIRVTEGINGLTPSLAISYAGPDTRSILGLGFDFAGISYIRPCAMTIAQDGTAAPVTLTSADRYCLDGARLRLVSGAPYGASETIYRTELDQLVRVTAKASTNNIPGWFKVELPNGLVSEYGNSADSKLLASGAAGAPTQFWAVNRISDRNGNSIAFQYDTDNSLRRHRPNYISYTERAGSGHYGITFVYQAATQPEPATEFTPSNGGGAAHSEDKLLERIDLSHDSTVYRRIHFSYQSSAANNKLLASVQECVPGAPDDCLPPTVFTWLSSISGHDSPVLSQAVASGIVPLDINGDAIKDLAWAESGTWRYMLGSANGFGAVQNTGLAVVNSSKAMPLEWNGDGFEDLLIDWSDGKWRVIKGSASGFVAPAVHAGPGAGIPSNAASTTWTVNDMDGDGLDDLLSKQLNAAYLIKMRLNSATGFGVEQTAFHQIGMRTTSIAFPKIDGASAIRRPDFNGDRRGDLLVYGCEWDLEFGSCFSYGWYQLISNGTTLVNQGILPYATYGIGIRFADFNSDGLTDVGYPAQTPSKWYLGFGQGGGGLAVVPGPSSYGYSNYLTLTGDYDGDGYHDFYAATSSSPQWHIFRGSSTGLAPIAIATGISAAGGGWMLTDQDGDGLPDLGRYDTSTLVWNTYSHSGPAGERLTSATDGLGNKLSFSYLPMTADAVYAKGTGATAPVIDVELDDALVQVMQIEPAGGIPYFFTYKYADARSHTQGRGFLGMGKREITDSRNGMHTVQTFKQDFPYIGAMDSVAVKQSASGPTIQSATHAYSNHVLEATAGNERWLPYRSQSVTKAYEVGGIKNGLQITEVTEDHTVSTFGNSTFVSITTVDKDSGSQEFGSIWKTEITSTFKQDTANWCIAAPTSRSEKRILPDLSNETRLTTWAVAGPECRVTQETIEPGAVSAISLVTDVGYDGCGNVSSISSYPAGDLAQARTTAINYGSRCQSPETITNPLNQPSTIVYNWPLNAPSRVTDPNGIYSDMEYDGFGRLTRRINPDLTATRFALTACTAGNGWCGKNSSARFKATQTARNTSDGILRTDEQFLDGFGRVRWAHSDSLESGPAIVETLFDGFGRPTQQTQPYFSGGMVYSTSYARDLIGRLTQVNAPIDEAATSGRITGFSYEGRDLKVTDPKSNVTTRRGNAIGQLRAVVDPSPGGTTLYAYKPFGEIDSITDAANNVTSWSYNLRRLVIGTTDPDSGSWTYETNAFGETTRIRDAKTAAPNWTTEFTFDKLSRPVTRSEAEGTTTWTWGTSLAAKNIGRLASITSPGSYSEVYAYDSLGRLSQQNVTADGTNHQINLAYVPTTGLLNTLEYPTSTSGYRLLLAYEYSSNLLKRVRDFNGSTTFWEAASTDAFGHVQLENFGNGVQTFTDFDQASGFMAAREGGLGGGTGLIHSQVAWDLNGNLIQRKDLKLSPTVTEDFFYDSLNRLDYSNRNGSLNLDIGLDAIGNITSKTSVGNYNYTTAQSGCTYYSHAQPRAVRKAGTTVYCYDANGNMTKRAGSTIGYTSYNLPSVINSGSNSSTLAYGAWRNRYRQVAVNAGANETTIYVAGLLEKVTRGSLVEYRHLIAGSTGMAAIHTRRTGGSPASDTVYVHTDHLGSPELFTSSSGTVLVRPSFAAYGERRDGSDWLGLPSAGDLTALGNISRRGFTGHEHLDAVNLIHMNGRVYEPVAGRFLGVDPIILLGNGQSPNSYSYVLNNPLTLVDPSGFSVRRSPCKQRPDGSFENCGDGPLPPPGPDNPRDNRPEGGGGDGGSPDRIPVPSPDRDLDKINCKFNSARAAEFRSDEENRDNLDEGTYATASVQDTAGLIIVTQSERRLIADFTTASVHRLKSFGVQVGGRAFSRQWSGGLAGPETIRITEDLMGWSPSAGISAVVGVGGSFSGDFEEGFGYVGIGYDVGPSIGATDTFAHDAWPIEDVPEDIRKWAQAFYADAFNFHCES